MINRLQPLPYLLMPFDCIVRVPLSHALTTPFQARLVAAKYGFRCAICGKMLDASWETDHIVPLSRGGSNDLSNLQAVHRIPCQQMKSSREATGR